MIGSAKRKLKQNSGATILMALMLFLACVTIAGVILGSAMTNLNKVKNQQEQLQVYESVSSAARLVCQRIQELTRKYMSRLSMSTANPRLPQTRTVKALKRMIYLISRS